MKRFLPCAMTLLLSFGLTTCGGSTESDSLAPEPTTRSAEPTEFSTRKELAPNAAKNETSVIEAMRTIATAQAAFQAAATSTHGEDGIGQYGIFSELCSPGNGEPLIDEELASGTKHGYNFFLHVLLGSPPKYRCTAVPIEPGVTGTRKFLVDESGVIRHIRADDPNVDEPIDATAPPVG